MKKLLPLLLCGVLSGGVMPSDSQIVVKKHLTTPILRLFNALILNKL